jgi:hypothetical protein
MIVMVNHVTEKRGTLSLLFSFSQNVLFFEKKKNNIVKEKYYYLLYPLGFNWTRAT